ncbi:hypothetical protein GW915_09695 [bacterium]|nr:hypothetical protein [bacterium]
MFKLLILSSTLVGAAVSAAPQVQVFEIPFGHGGQVVKASYHLDTEHWTLLPPKGVKATITPSNGAEDLETVEQCDRKFNLYKSFDKNLAKERIRPKSYQGENPFMKLKIVYDGFVPYDPLFQVEIRKVAQKHSLSMESFPADAQAWGRSVGEVTRKSDISFVWADNAYSNFLGVEDIEKELLQQWSKYTAFSATMREELKTPALDLVCDLLTGRLKVKIPVDVWVTNVAAKNKRISEADFIRVYQNLKQTWVSQPTVGLPDHVKASYSLASSFREEMGRGLLTNRIESISLAYSEFFDSNTDLKPLGAVSLRNLVDSFAEDTVLRYDFEYQLEINGADAP